MPKELESCVSSLLSKWKEDPSTRPKPKEGQDDKSQAYAICNAATKNSMAESLSIMLEGGYGPVLIGAAATNRPYIPQLEETKVVEVDGNKKLVVHLANPGFFNHPSGSFVLNHAVFSTIAQNFDNHVLGQSAAYDCRHKPDAGAFGWFEKLWIEDKKLYGRVDPTPVGLEQIQNRAYLYSSMEFHRNYNRDDVKLDLEDASGSFCALDLGDNYTSEINKLGYVFESNENTEEDMPTEEEIRLEKELEEEREERKKEQDRIAALEKERNSAAERVIALEREAIDNLIKSVVELSVTYKDKDGMSLPKQFTEWVSKVLKFENFGDGDNVVALSDDKRPDMETAKYLAGAVRALILSMPGTVPSDRKTQDATDPVEFNFGSLWDKGD